MNERLTYEQLIGDKLQHLPVPDMQDAIWLRIKTELDKDMPEGDDDGNGSNVPQAPKSPAFIGWGLAVVVVALIAAFLLFKKAPKTKANTKQADTATQIISPPAQSTDPPLPTIKAENKTSPLIKRGPQQAVGTTVAAPPTTPPDVSMPANKSNDSAQQIQPSVVNPAPAKTDSVAPVKKGKGMKGIKDEDYRIVPKNKKE